jgi:hypothetical protein
MKFFDPMTFDEAPFITVQYDVYVDQELTAFDDAYCNYQEAFDAALAFARAKKAEGHDVIMAVEPFDDIIDIDTGEPKDICPYNPEEEDRRKDYLENYAAEELGFEAIESDELPF